MSKKGNIPNKVDVSASRPRHCSTARGKRKPLALYKRWIVDKKGKRKYGTNEFMRENLESNISAMLKHLRGERNSLNDICAAMYARRSAHWALALAGKLD